MGAAKSNCMRRGDVSKPINGLEDIAPDGDVRPSLPPDDPMSGKNTGDVAAAAVASTTTTTPSEESGKRRHSTPSCGTGHLSRLGDDLSGVEDVGAVRWRRSGSAAPRRLNRPTNEDCRRNALPPWAEAVRSSRAGDGSASMQRGAGAGQSNYASDGRLDLVDSAGSGGRGSGTRYDAQISSDAGLSPPRDHVHPSQPAATAGQARPLQERRRSLAFLPVSSGSTGSGAFSPRHVVPSTSAKDRLNLGLGNASDFVASLISSKSPGPSTGATEDHFWVPSTVWRKKRAQSLVPSKLSSDAKADTRAVSGELIHCLY